MKAKVDLNFMGQTHFVDLIKVFDTLDYKLSINKLDYYGFGGPK